MRVGVVVSAQEFPEARRPALKLEIDFGPLGVKRSSAQITRHYTPAAL
ncbi:MAG TPA: tRNA-binding protein, partial [Methylomirabilota bacterium]|nr:tRNA-binding protein [Methylomirabilota bacterium]